MTSIFVFVAVQIFADFNAPYDALDSACLLTNKMEVDELLNHLVVLSKKFKKNDLKVVDRLISDLKLISNANKEVQNKILRQINEILVETNKDDENIKDDRFKDIDTKMKRLESFFGQDSFYTILLKIRIMSYKATASKDGISYNEFEIMKKSCIKSFGLESILGSELYVVLCMTNNRMREWSELKKNAEISLEIKTKLGINGDRIITPVSFLIKSNVMMGNYRDAIKNKDKLESYFLEETDTLNLRPQLRIFSSLATAYTKLDKITNAIAMQEMAVAAACEIFKSDSPQAKEQALVLRELLAKSKEFTFMRNLEDRFKLQPLPLQNGEK